MTKDTDQAAASHPSSSPPAPPAASSSPTAEPEVVVEAPSRPPERRRFRYHQTLAGKYRLEKSLARGGMGWVFLATQLPLHRQVAVKILQPGTRDSSFRERFLLEASTCAKLQHPHIVTIHDYGETEDGDLFMAMEYLDGPSLSSVLSKAGRLSVERGLRVIMQVVRALRAAHKAGVVHRDLKPSNIMLLSHDEDETRDFVKVVDFGLAKLFEGDGQGGAIELTRAGTLLGSPRYMSPEQIRNRAVDPRTDVYSLGVILFYVLTGRPPFNSDNATDILAQHLRDPVPSLSEAAGELEIPIELERIVHRCMAKHPAKRYPSVDELARDLKAAYEGYLEGSLPSDSFDEAGATVAAPLIADLSDSVVPPELTPPPLPQEALSGSISEPSGAGSGGTSAAADDTRAEPPHAEAARPLTDPQVGPGADFTPPPEEPKRRRAALWLVPLLLLLLVGFWWWGRAPAEPTSIPVETAATEAPAPPPPAPTSLTLRTEPSGLVLVDEAGAELGTSPLEVPTPSPAHPLRVRARLGELTSPLRRVLPTPGADAITLDLRGWVAEAEAAAEAAQRVAEDEVRPRPSPRRARRATRSAARPIEPPDPEADPPETPAIAEAPAPAKAPSPVVPTLDDPKARPKVGIIDEKKPRIDLIEDASDPSIGLVDEGEAPRVGIIEE